ncbi:rhodanese-like domain-containing protein [Brenneria corticis]|uniref:Rhodanese domain-containing protein n=1 Tax=Brenneria corticis TaxID=2173106 RepID=A0A2U1UD26_9GAMM|nr:rhodanese-like domain-containing protein [Brenneria sp. CFCC 11842]PWC19517.1 hypothetical protein DDT56_00640 [Brenneria sp. CFCC 11842]
MAITLVSLPAGELRRWLDNGDELAVLDVREEGEFGGGHLLRSTNLPLSRLENQLTRLLPRKGVPLVLVDDDNGLAEQAAEKLMAYGYRTLYRLTDGVAGWRQAGWQLVRGNYVFSKAFGEYVEHVLATPHISAQRLQEKISAGEDLVIIDSRTFAEYQWIGIPGAVSCPGAELILRVKQRVTSPDTLVVVNCGGRTRSIIGAQTLINAGLANPVVSLQNGTQGWHLAGYRTVAGQQDRLDAPDRAALRWARQAARTMAQRSGVVTLDRAGLHRLEAESRAGTLYRFDVRSGEEYRQGHRRGFLSVEGGQLIQATNTFIAVHRARIVLADDDGVRAYTTASWLRQMGFDQVFVLDAPLTPADYWYGDSPEIVAGPQSQAALLSPFELLSRQEDEGVVVIDLASSREYRQGHIPGAWFAIRSRLAQALTALPPAREYVLTSPDGLTARLALTELAALVTAPVSLLAGGTRAWQAARLPLASGDEHLANPPVDVVLKAFEQPERREEAMRAYLRWEQDLVAQIEREGSTRFRLLSPPVAARDRQE